MADTLQCRPAPIPDKGRRAIRGGDGLSPREQAVLKLIGEGRTNKMIAHTQGVAPETVKTHIKNIFAKLGVERRAQAVAKAQRLGLLAT
jgi:LuxR family maltose regulon positive regulatory protein